MNTALTFGQPSLTQSISPDSGATGPLNTSETTVVVEDQHSHAYVEGPYEQEGGAIDPSPSAIELSGQASVPSDRRAAAIFYAEKGWRVLPLNGIRDGKCTCGRSTCKSPGKHPRTRHGVEDATTDATLVGAWWAKWPDANIGIALGPKSGLLALDADTPEAVQWLKEHLPEDLDRYCTVDTSPGRLQVHFTYPDGVVPNSQSRIAPGLEVRGEGLYVVAPPSVHAGGYTYRYRSTTDPTEAPKEVLDLILAESKSTKSASSILSSPRAMTNSYGSSHQRCPFPDHEDLHPSFQIDAVKGTYHCWGCGKQGSLAMLAHDLEQAQVQFGLDPTKPYPPVSGRTPNSTVGLTLAELIAAKQLDQELLAREGAIEHTYNQRPAIRFPYYSADGRVLAVRHRMALCGDRFRWRAGDRVHLYGLHHLEEIRSQGWVLLCEGETDCLTAWQAGLPCLGIPGKDTWTKKWTPILEGLEVYLWQEPDAADLTERVRRDVPNVKVMLPPPGVKDLNDAHVQGLPVAWLVDTLKEQARGTEAPTPTVALPDVTQLEAIAAPVLESRDPLELVKTALRNMGYGGDLRAALLAYIAVTGRVLAMRRGSMPVHILVIGPPAAGKSFLINCVLDLLPSSAYVKIDAGSPRVLIYWDEPLAHRVLVFSEADSLPASEDNPAASAVRNLLQENELNYDVTERDPETGGFRVRHIRQAGPTTLVTTAVKHLGAQLESRLFVLDAPDDQTQIRAALKAQARLEAGSELPEADEPLVAFQTLLQSAAPWQVVVPFAERLSEYLGDAVADNSIIRGFAHVLSFVKAIAVLRNRHRERRDDSRLVATLDDYATFYELAADLFQAGGAATARVHQTVEAIRTAIEREGRPVSLGQVAKALGLSKGATSVRVKNALRGGWLINEETKPGQPLRLSLGEPLGSAQGLPSPETLRTMIATSSGTYVDESTGEVFGVRPETGREAGDAVQEVGRQATAATSRRRGGRPGS